LKMAWSKRFIPKLFVWHSSRDIVRMKWRYYRTVTCFSISLIYWILLNKIIVRPTRTRHSISNLVRREKGGRLLNSVPSEVHNCAVTSFSRTSNILNLIRYIHIA